MHPRSSHSPTGHFALAGLSRATNCREYCRDLHCELGDSCAWMREVQQLRVRANALAVRCAFQAVVSVMLQKGKSNNKRSRTFSRTRIAIEGAWHSRERVQDSRKLSAYARGFIKSLTWNPSSRSDGFWFWWAWSTVCVSLAVTPSTSSAGFLLLHGKKRREAKNCFCTLMALYLNCKWKEFGFMLLLLSHWNYARASVFLAFHAVCEQWSFSSYFTIFACMNVTWSNRHLSVLKGIFLSLSLSFIRLSRP